MKARPKMNSTDAIIHYEVASTRSSCRPRTSRRPFTLLYGRTLTKTSSKSWKSGWLEWTPIFAVTVILKLDDNSQMRINAPCIYRLWNSCLNIKVVRNEIQVNRSTQCLQLRHTFFFYFGLDTSAILTKPKCVWLYLKIHPSSWNG